MPHESRRNWSIDQTETRDRDGQPGPAKPRGPGGRV